MGERARYRTHAVLESHTLRHMVLRCIVLMGGGQGSAGMMIRTVNVYGYSQSRRGEWAVRYKDDEWEAFRLGGGLSKWDDRPSKSQVTNDELKSPVR